MIQNMRVFLEIVQKFFLACFHIFNDLFFIQHIVLSVFNCHRVKNCNFLTLSLGCHGKGFVYASFWSWKMLVLVAKIFYSNFIAKENNIAALWKQKIKSKIQCNGDRSTLGVSASLKEHSITNGWKTNTTMDNREILSFGFTTPKMIVTWSSNNLPYLK